METNVNVLWFSKSNDSSSFSRITDSILPFIRKKYKVTLLSNFKKESDDVLVGENTKSVSYTEYCEIMKKSNPTIDSFNLDMKYIILQIVDLIYENNYKYLVMCNGIYEIDWFVKILNNPKFLTNKNGQKTKIVVWTPIDYIPSLPIITNMINADIFLTMTPVMVDEIKKLVTSSSSSSSGVIDWVGHGSNIVEEKEEKRAERSEIIKNINNMRQSKLIHAKQPIDESDIIILNANNCKYTTRKRLDITVQAFIKVLKESSNPRKIKLWIHTHLKTFFDTLANVGISIESISDNLILSDNTLTNQQLSYVYMISQISIQTSLAEGWSMTNMEGAYFRSLQIVPDFLATGYHFGDGKGLLIPVTRIMDKSQTGEDVVVGLVSIDDTADKLKEGIELLLNNSENLSMILNKAEKYVKSCTWANIAEQFIGKLQ